MAKKQDRSGLIRGKLSMTTDPRVFERMLPAEDEKGVRFVGLDLASSAGVAFCDIVPGQVLENVPIAAGQWNLSVGKFDTNPLRYIRLQEFLEVLRPDFIAYEEVKYTGSAAPPGMSNNFQALVARAVSGASVVQGLCATLTTWAERKNIPCEGVPIGTLKKFATGRGNANKVEMIQACNEKFGMDLDAGSYKETGADNVADAVWLCVYGVSNYSKGMGDGR